MLAGLFAPRSGRARRLRELIVDLAAPVTGVLDAVPRRAAPSSADGDSALGGLNAEQREAVDRCWPVARPALTIIVLTRCTHDKLQCFHTPCPSWP